MSDRCLWCGGTGRVVYQYGPPGTDRHAKYADIEWGPRVERDCPVCLSTGWAKVPRKQRPERGALMLHAPDQALQRALDQLKENQ